VHGLIELTGGPVAIDDVPAHRVHRWGDHLTGSPFPAAVAHLGLRAPFAFPDGGVVDLVLTPAGWQTRQPHGL
jgi:hypothetical protein